jgi:peptidyl-dipeptidase A
MRFSTIALSFTTLALAAACGGETPPPAAPCPACPPPVAAPPPVAQVPPPASPEEAKKFVEQVDKDLRRLWVARDRASWVNLNFITDDTEALSAAGEEATAA